MRPYKTNSPQYLDYIASCKTKQQILDDPRLCVLLNDPTIKENMELACAYNEAEWGDLQSKIEFVEYFFCNGPELDADTLIYYAKKIKLDDDYTAIANYYFNDMDKVDMIREQKYGKKKNKDNCFSQPCNYLQRFGAGIGLMGDKNNSQKPGNAAAEQMAYDAEIQKVRKAYADEGREWKEADKEKFDKEWKEKHKNVIAPKSDPEEKMSSWCRVKQHLYKWFVPSTFQAICSMSSYKDEQMQEHVNNIRDAHLSHYCRNSGDPYAISFQKRTELQIKANVKRSMGDCARLWEHARRLKMFSIAQNTATPIPPEAETREQAVGGAPKAAEAMAGATIPAKNMNASPMQNRPFSPITEFNSCKEADLEQFKNMNVVSGDSIRPRGISDLEAYVMYRGPWAMSAEGHLGRKKAAGGYTKQQWKEIQTYYNTVISKFQSVAKKIDAEELAKQKNVINPK